MLRLLILALIALPLPAAAADRVVGVGSFSRLRVDGAFAVVVTTGRSPGARISGERAVIDAIEVKAEGDTLVVRRLINGAWGERGTVSATLPVTIAVTTPALASAAVVGGGKVTVNRMAGPRIDLSVTGPGAIAVALAEADAVNVQLIGSGGIAVAGKAATVRLATNGPGTIDAAKLIAGDLILRLDGAGQTSAAARYTARVTSTGLGTVTVAGTPKCEVKALSTAPITCGTGPAR